MDILTKEKANAIKELKLDLTNIKRVAGKESRKIKNSNEFLKLGFYKS
jgi:hypothetical protein